MLQGEELQFRRPHNAKAFRIDEVLPSMQAADALGLGQPEPVETYSTSEHLFRSLGIPQGATGTLPTARRDRLG